MENNTGNVLFPVFLKLHHLEMLIVGGGKVGLEKLEAVLRNSPAARVTLVAKELLAPEIMELAAKHPQVKVKIRKFKKSDLKGKDVVILATDSRALHEKIVKRTRKMHLLANVADTPDLCDFYLGAIVKKGDLKIGISTNGKSPTLAKRLRENLDAALPNEIDDMLARMQEIREQLRGDFEEKVRLLDEITANFKPAKSPKAP